MEKKLYLAVDILCHECSVSIEVLGVYNTKKEAEDACDKRSDETENWRDGGKSIQKVFEITTPSI